MKKEHQPIMMFYERPVLLNRNVHRNARLMTAAGMAFAARSNSFLLAAEECVDAMRDYPILFVGSAESGFTLAALTGLRTDENLFVSNNGMWLAGAYIPAFVRRYPFVLVDPADGAEMQIAVDENCRWLDLPGAGHDGERLFTDGGENSKLLDDIAVFMLRYHRGMEQSRQFAATVYDMDLLVSRVIEVKSPTGKSALDNFWVVDEQALYKLSPKETKTLTDAGYMGWIHFHLGSLANVQKLANLTDAADPPTALPPAPKPRSLPS